VIFENVVDSVSNDAVFAPDCVRPWEDSTSGVFAAVPTHVSIRLICVGRGGGMRLTAQQKCGEYSKGYVRVTAQALHFLPDFLSSSRVLAIGARGMVIACQTQWAEFVIGREQQKVGNNNCGDEFMSQGCNSFSSSKTYKLSWDGGYAVMQGPLNYMTPIEFTGTFQGEDVFDVLVRIYDRIHVSVNTYDDSYFGATSQGEKCWPVNIHVSSYLYPQNGGDVYIEELGSTSTESETSSSSTSSISSQSPSSDSSEVTQTSGGSMSSELTDSSVSDTSYSGSSVSESDTSPSSISSQSSGSSAGTSQTSDSSVSSDPSGSSVSSSSSSESTPGESGSESSSSTPPTFTSYSSDSSSSSSSSFPLGSSDSSGESSSSSSSTPPYWSSSSSYYHSDSSYDSSESTESSYSSEEPEHDEGTCECGGYTKNPVRYFNGQVRIEQVDVRSQGLGVEWMHKRTYNNQQTPVDVDRGNGWNWVVSGWPQLETSTLAGTSVRYVSNAYSPVFFSYDEENNAYHSQFGNLTKLYPSGAYLVLVESDGTQRTFHNFDHATRPGGFVSMSAPGGETLAVTQVDGPRITEVKQTSTVNGQSVIERFVYEFGTSGAELNRLLTCTLSRKVGTAAEQDVERVVYTYYDSSSFGSRGDLESVTRQRPSSIVAPGSSSSSSSSSSDGWIDAETDYYRYHKAGSGTGNAHDLKYVCKPSTYARIVADGLNPLTISDAALAAYADHYFEYDANDRVVLEKSYGGTLTSTLAYDRNPRALASSSSSGAGNDTNAWVFKTTEGLPDGSERIVFANYAGQTMLRVTREASDESSSSVSSSSSSAAAVREWYEFTRYDEDGRVVLTADPAAITGYDENYDDLLGYSAVSGEFEYLRNSQGQVQRTEYYVTSNPAASYPQGYIKNRKIQEGQTGTLIPQQAWEYTYHTVGADTIFPISKSIQYPDDSTPATTIETSYAYSFYSGTTQVKQKTTTLPVIASGQNGSGSANTRKEYFDERGYLVWEMDERGFITNYTYDAVTGALIQQVSDVDTSTATGVPSGWSTPAGGGLNLVTDIEVDELGRHVQLLGPSHTVDLDGVATTVRTAEWTVYDDENHVTKSAQGYATGTAPAYTFTLVNPVRIQVSDAEGRVLEDIEAVRSSPAGKLTEEDTFPQSSYTRWKTYEYSSCCLLQLERAYFNIPASGQGLKSVHYLETSYRYDENKRRNVTISPGGTITRLVHDVRDNVISTWIGTNDSGATSDDPAGGGTPGNNMVCVNSSEFDAGLGGGNGNLTRQIQHVDALVTRETEYTYDFRNRRVTSVGEIDYFEKQYYDNLNRVFKTERYDTSELGNLIARQESDYDALNRVYETRTYAVDPSTGTVGNSLVDRYWFDASGNVVKAWPSGSDQWTKTTYDSLSRNTVEYLGYGSDSVYADVFSVSGDVILEQTETEYDAAGNTLKIVTRRRYHNAPDTQTGPLGDPSTAPKSRLSYVANYSDPLGRTQDTADYGTNGGSALVRSNTVPARSDTVLIQSQRYDEAGNVVERIDPIGMVTRFEFDDLGRKTAVIENAVSEESSSSVSSSSSGSGSEADCSASADTNRTTQISYTPDGQIASLIAVNASTGNQVTTYSYGTTLGDSDIATSHLLRKVTYPDSAGGSDVVLHTYNRQMQPTSLTDQNGSVHQFVYDLQGRKTQDRVTTLGSGVDGSIRRIEQAYDVRGLLQRITSYDNPAVGTGTIRNEVRFAYNAFGQATTTWQAHAGAVDTMSTPKVQSSYANGANNTVRPTARIYPNGRQVNYSYGSGIDEAVSRVAAIVDNASSQELAEYAYVGLGLVIEQDSPEADLRYTLVDLAGSNDPATGDIYTGLDRFGRVKDLRWRNTDSNTDLSRVEYGYNRASSRIWRKNPTDSNREYDWLYGYDGLQRLATAERGTLNSGETAITSPQFAQCWSLDATGNWNEFRESDNGSAWSLQQARTANPVNELTDITNTVGQPWADPAYDANGNMTTIPTGRAVASGSSSSSSVSSSSEETAPAYIATYDAWNRLVKLEDPGTSDTVQENAYDGRNFRVVRSSYEDGLLSETRHYYYTNEWQIVEERVGASTTPDRQFVWGVRYIDDLICRDRSTTVTLDERLYSLADANWNVTAVVDTTGSVVERIEYDPYGATAVLTPTFTARTTSNYVWETIYCGYRWDAASLFSVRYRVYHPRFGTWTTRDPSGYAARSLGLYEYVSSIPIVLVDPLGLEELDLTISFVEDMVTATAALAVNPDFEITPSGNAKGGLGKSVKKYGKGKNKKGKKNDNDWKGKNKNAKNKWKWGEAKTKLTELVAGGQNCIRSVTFTGHGWDGRAATFNINTVKAASGSEEAAFLDILKKNKCKGECTILLNHCRSAKGEAGQKFIQVFADETGYTVDGFTDIYAVKPHGERWSATPAGTAPVHVDSFPAYQGDGSLQNITDSWEWLLNGTTK